jgi:hypothetical protein
LAQVALAQVEQQVQVEHRQVTAAVALRQVMAAVAQVDLRQVTAGLVDLRQVPLVQVALQPVTAGLVDLHRVPLVRVALQPVTVAQADLRQVPLVRVALQPVTVVAAQVALPQEHLLRGVNRGRNFSLLLKSAVSVEWAESVPWGQQAAQGPVRWGCEAERPDLLGQGLVEPAGPDCNSVDPVHRVE